MGGDFVKTFLDKGDARLINTLLAHHVIEQILKCGIRDICVCSGARNTPFIPILKSLGELNCYYWFEERSAAFFALGKSRTTHSPTAIVTTSGTAAGELLPATMEAYYSGVPLLLITADRPRHFRGSGAPQSAEQVGLYGCYTSWSQDVAEGESIQLNQWGRVSPGHLNVCFEEPKQEIVRNQITVSTTPLKKEKKSTTDFTAELDDFFQRSRYPQVIVGGLQSFDQEAVVQLLLRLKVPVYLEGISGIREDSRLQHLKTPCIQQFWTRAEKGAYPIDGILRVGTVPTARIWRDLEEKKRDLRVCSVTHLPFSGLGRTSTVIHGDVDHLLNAYQTDFYNFNSSNEWISTNQEADNHMIQLFGELPNSEPALFHQLSKLIPEHAFVYIGNSMPIREWDLAASQESKNLKVAASRGLNGIDGQLATFLGMCQSNTSNWAILGDLTTLYDLAAPWILPEMADFDITIVVINNGGGKIFERMFSDVEIQNRHDVEFEKFAQLWNIPYERWDSVPKVLTGRGIRLVELVPDEQETKLFWKSLNDLGSNPCARTLYTVS